MALKCSKGNFNLNRRGKILLEMESDEINLQQKSKSVKTIEAQGIVWETGGGCLVTNDLRHQGAHHTGTCTHNLKIWLL